LKWAAAAAALFALARYPHQASWILTALFTHALAVLIAAFVVWIALCVAKSRTTSGGAGMGMVAPRAAATGGRCGACAIYVKDIAAHEAGHATVAEALGYQVTGAIVYGWGAGGFTAIPGWTDNPWHTMVMAAAGRSGENRNRMIFTADLDGGKRDEYSDAWWIHRLAPQIAKARGVTRDEAIEQARAEADRILAANTPQWRRQTDVLNRDRRIGDVTDLL